MKTRVSTSAAALGYASFDVLALSKARDEGSKEELSFLSVSSTSQDQRQRAAVTRHMTTRDSIS